MTTVPAAGDASRPCVSGCLRRQAVPGGEDRRRETAANEENARRSRSRVLSVNVGRAVQADWHGRTVRSSIWKSPVTGPVEARGVNLIGDAQADRKAHGGPDKSVYAYAAEDLDWWNGQLGLGLDPGSMGENLTTTGLDLSEAVVGDRWQVGSVQLQVTQPRIPCYKLGIRVGDDEFPQRFAEARRHGVYLRILTEGELQAGDEVHVVHRLAHGLRAVEVAHIFYDHHERAGELLCVPELAASWHRWARRILDTASHEGTEDAGQRRSPR